MDPSYVVCVCARVLVCVCVCARVCMCTPSSRERSHDIYKILHEFLIQKLNP